jgi:hypothetical protein
VLSDNLAFQVLPKVVDYVGQPAGFQTYIRQVTWNSFESVLQVGEALVFYIDGSGEPDCGEIG